jgi:hypothetical protein
MSLGAKLSQQLLLLECVKNCVLQREPAGHTFDTQPQVANALPVVRT